MISSKFIYLAIGVAFFLGIPSSLFGQSNDFFSNTQVSGSLAAGASGCPNGTSCAAGNPGFNPTDLVKRADPNATFSGVTPTGAAPSVFFSQLGPGAITDNMFGVVSTILSTNSTLCGNLPGDPNIGPGVLPTAVGPNGSSLNCGDLRFDPTSQGQTIPTVPASNNLQNNLNPITVGRVNVDFNPSSDDHLGLDLVNDFTFVLSPLSASSTQQTLQVTALTAGGTAATVGTPGTLASFGSGDQRIEIDTSWSLTGTFDSTSNHPTVTWSMSLDTIDPLTPTSAPFSSNTIDTTNTIELLTSSGSFEYNNGSFPQSSIPFPCWWSGCTLSSESITIP